MKGNLREAIALTVVLLLAGCGGESNNAPTTLAPGSGNTPPPAPFLRTLAGHAVAGIIQGGQVVVEEISETGRSLRELDRVTTANDGEYFLLVPSTYTGGSLRLTVSGIGGQTTMVCSVKPSCGAIPFGGLIPLDESFSFVALLPSLSLQSNYAQINPHTDLAASRTGELNGYSPQNIIAAQREVNTLFAGVDLQKTTGLDLTKPDQVLAATPAERSVAIINSAIVKIAYENQSSLAITQAQFREAFRGGMIAPSGTGITAQSIVDAIDAQYQALAIEDEIGVVPYLREKITSAIAAQVFVDP